MFGMDRYNSSIDMSKGLDLMRGKTFAKVVADGDEMLFETAHGERFVFGHDQDCCESVYIEDITGDIEDLIGEPLLLVEEVSGETPADFDPDAHDSYTWTFYKFATRKGYVDVRWLGESNGYYSERVDLFHAVAEAVTE